MVCNTSIHRFKSGLRLSQKGFGNVLFPEFFFVRKQHYCRKELALYKFKYEMAVAEKSVKEEGTISADDLEAELGGIMREKA